MNTLRRALFSTFLMALMLCAAFGASAQGDSNGTLVLGQPAVSQVTAAGQTFNYDYSLTEPRQITLQALGDSAQPTIKILQNGTVVAEEANAAGALTITLNALLNAGSYVVQVGTLNNTTGLVVLVLQSETTVTSETLTPGTLLSGTVNTGAPLALYSFTSLSEPAYLYVESSQPDSGVNVRLTDAGSGTVSGMINASLTGARFRIPAGNAAYVVEVETGGGIEAELFTICLAAVSTGGCEAGSAQAPVVTEDVVVVEPPPVERCTVTSNAGGPVNIRQSASTVAVIVGSLPVNTPADVIGISPDGFFYNVLYSGTNGWISAAVVNTSGNCDTILTINPPVVIEQPAQPAQPTAVPVQPTQPPPPTPSGPCLITLTAPTNVYQIPNNAIDYLQDQVQSGELIPIGRLADNSWWKTNYANAWIQTSAFGSTAQVSGDCRNLPLVTP